MKIFDKLIDYLFETDNDGRRIFYPNGFLGKRYFIPEKKYESEIRKLIGHFYFAIFITCIIFIASIILFKVNKHFIFHIYLIVSGIIGISFIV